MRVHKLTFAALAVAATLSLSACNDGDDSAGDSPSPESTASSSSGGSGSGGSDQEGGKDSGGKDSAGQSSGGQGAATGGGSDTSAKVGKCRTDELDITATDSTVDGDTEGTVAVTFKNGSGKDCALTGFAGVDLKTSEGDLSATRSGQSSPMTLKDGDEVSFGVTYPVNDSGGSGVSVSAIVVTPPGETKSFSMEWPGAATLPVTEGGGTPVKVGPMGSAGQGGAN
ncbi:MULTISPECIES: DUF4232 domain-containing protein [Streptomyces]|uniref:DUF4232 domain-containing protein n=1 Tax=Streptomyces alboflavus TaxID=67267 RepID=A0A1Z1W2Y2_9ACTN|nr:DUF4232 domain-containing protein [Streptomyces alboflavus]ARX80776.1 hypothetical protein SMD44_00174 [Streptomyces alboflavus]